MENRCKNQRGRNGILITIAIVFLSACNNGDDPAPAPQKFCKLVSETTTTTGPSSPGVTYTTTQKHTAGYDERGNRVTESLSYDHALSDGKNYRRSGSYSYQYDANDFLVRLVVQQSDTYDTGETTIQSNDHTYEYDHGRVSKITSVSTSNGATTTSSSQYEYDDQGRLIKLTTSNNSYSKYEYLGNGTYKITRVDKNGNSNSPFIEFNSAGLIVKTIVTQEGSTTERRYEYNAEGSMIRQEVFNDGKPSSAEATEYDNKDNPYGKSFAPPKGPPTIPSLGPEINQHNVTRVKRFSGNATTGQWDIKEDVTYTYEYNGQNLPTKSTSKTIDKDGKEISTGTGELNYQDCP